MRFKDAEVIICRNQQNSYCPYKHKAKCLYFQVYYKDLNEVLKKAKVYFPILSMLQNKKSVSLLNLKSDNAVLKLVAETMIFNKCPKKHTWDYIGDENKSVIKAFPSNSLRAGEWRTINTLWDLI